MATLKYGLSLHLVNNEEPMEKKGLSKSSLVKIRPEDLTISIPLNAQYLTEIEMGSNPAHYFLLAVPHYIWRAFPNALGSDIKTIQDGLMLQDYSE